MGDGHELDRRDTEVGGRERRKGWPRTCLLRERADVQLVEHELGEIDAVKSWSDHTNVSTPRRARDVPAAASASGRAALFSNRARRSNPVPWPAFSTLASNIPASPRLHRRSARPRPDLDRQFTALGATGSESSRSGTSPLRTPQASVGGKITPIAQMHANEMGPMVKPARAVTAPSRGGESVEQLAKLAIPARTARVRRSRDTLSNRPPTTCARGGANGSTAVPSLAERAHLSCSRSAVIATV
jgi:hypothetical protein